jgi:flagellar protein FlaI
MAKKPVGSGKRMSASAIVRKLREGYAKSLEPGEAPSMPFQPGQQFPQGFPGQFYGVIQQPNQVNINAEKIELEEKEKGMEIPMKYMPVTAAPSMTAEEIEDMKNTKKSYNLIPSMPAKGELVYAYASIAWDGQTGELAYSVHEPQITKYDIEIVEKVKRDLEERLDVDFTKLGDVRAKELLISEIKKSLSSMIDLKIDEMRKNVISYFIQKEILGFGKIEPLMKDDSIEDISCDGVGIPLYVYHRDPKIGSLRTNLYFETEDELNSFILKLAQKCNKSISIAEPLLDGSLPDGSRIQATLGTDIARRGSNFTVRKFMDKPLTPTHMIKYNTMNAAQLAYLWIGIENGQSILISGGTATGKTSMLNALSLFIRPNLKIVSIEDTAELRLPHPHWIPEVARTPLAIEGRIGEVSLFDLLKSSLRQRPDYIVLGEVRGKEAFVLFQQMATGHPSLATIHAASFPQLVDRLITPPISLPPTLIENINIIVFLVSSKLHGSYVRRSESILEVVGLKGDRPMTRKIFEWNPSDDSFITAERSLMLTSVAKRQGSSEDTMKNELMKRKKILEWLYEKGVYDYVEVARVISMYYSNPEKLMELVESG